MSAECLVVDHGEELFELVDDEQKLGAVIWQYARYGTPKPVRVTLELLDQALERMRREILQRSFDLSQRIAAGHDLDHAQRTEGVGRVGADAGHDARTDEARFSAPRRAHDADKPRSILQAFQQLVDEIVTTVEVTCVSSGERPKALVRVSQLGALRRAIRRVPTKLKLRRLPKNRLLEILELLARLDTQHVSKLATRLLIGLECIALAGTPAASEVIVSSEALDTVRS